MKNKQELVIELLHEHLADTKIGIIIKGVDDVLPEEIIKALAGEKRHLYAAAIGYEEVEEHSEEQYDIRIPLRRLSSGAVFLNVRGAS